MTAVKPLVLLFVFMLGLVALLFSHIMRPRAPPNPLERVAEKIAVERPQPHRRG